MSAPTTASALIEWLKLDRRRGSAWAALGSHILQRGDAKKFCDAEAIPEPIALRLRHQGRWDIPSTLTVKVYGAVVYVWPENVAAVQSILDGPPSVVYVAGGAADAPVMKGRGGRWNNVSCHWEVPAATADGLEPIPVTSRR